MVVKWLWESCNDKLKEVRRGKKGSNENNLVCALSSSAAALAAGLAAGVDCALGAEEFGGWCIFELTVVCSRCWPSPVARGLSQ
jgi:hypothetical protein